MTATMQLATSIFGLTSGSKGLSQVVTGIQEGVGKLGKMFGDVWANMKEIAEEKIEAIKEKWDEVKDFFSPLTKGAKTLWKMLKEGWDNFITDMNEALEKLPERWTKFKEDTEERLSGLRDWLTGIPASIMEKVDELGGRVSNWVGKWREKLGGLRDDLKEKIQPHLERMLKPFKDIWEWIQKIKADIVGRIGKVVDFVVGKPDKAETTVGTAVSGGVTQNFSMNVNASGITDRSDKRQLARDIGDMIQQETARGMGGTTQASRVGR